jgi:hypothetical protein
MEVAKNVAERTKLVDILKGKSKDDMVRLGLQEDIARYAE